MTCIELDWESLQFAIELTDETVIFAANDKHPDAIKYADESLRASAEFMQKVFRPFREPKLPSERRKSSGPADLVGAGGAVGPKGSKRGTKMRSFFQAAPLEDDAMSELHDDRWRSLAFVADSLRANRDAMFEFIKQDWKILRFADDATRADEEVVGAAVDQDWRALKFADANLRADRSIVLRAVAADNPHMEEWRALQFAADSVKADFRFMLRAMEKSVDALEHASEKLLEDPTFMLKAGWKNWRALEFAAPSLKQDRVFMLKAIEEAEAGEGVSLKMIRRAMNNTG